MPQGKLRGIALLCLCDAMTTSVYGTPPVNFATILGTVPVQIIYKRMKINPSSGIFWSYRIRISASRLPAKGHSGSLAEYDGLSAGWHATTDPATGRVYYSPLPRQVGV